jgi:hypothetical protein
MTKRLLALTLLLAGLSTMANGTNGNGHPTDGGQQASLIKCGKPVCL